MKLGRMVLLAFLMTSPVACDGEQTAFRPVPDLRNIKTNLTFTCAHEADRLPPLPPDADILFNYARWLARNNLLKEDPGVFKEIARLYRIAAANGHHKANFNLQNGISAHELSGSIDEILDLNDQLLKAGVPDAYYNLGHFLENGMGVKEDHDLALKYFRKAADLGSPYGQYYVAEKLAPIDRAPDIARQMRRCAAEQGHGEAALALGNDLQTDKSYFEALSAFQIGVRAGNETAAFALETGFNGPSTDNMNFLGQSKDSERYRRYKAIANILGNYSYLSPKVPEIDAIVPLPPAPLPAWDGTLQWVKDYEANIPPTKPDEALIARLAHEKGLDPETGRPLKAKHSAAETEPAPLKTAATPTTPLGLQLPTGATSPHTGTWACSPEQGASRRVFVAGEILAGVRIPAQPSLWQKLKGEAPSQVIDTTWTLVELPESSKA